MRGLGDPEKTLQGLDALLGHPSASDEYVRFRAALLRAQRAAFAGAASLHSAAGGESSGRAPWPVHAGSVPFEARAVSALAAGIGSALLDGATAALEQIAARATEVIPLACFGQDTPAFGDAAARAGAGPDAALFFGRALGAPFVTEAVRRHVEAFGPPPARARQCPACGSPAGLAVLSRTEGQRRLLCPLCSHSWSFDRVGCVHCGARTGLGRLAESQESPRWVETCARCGGYVKTLDERLLPVGLEVLPLVEATASLYLDYVAVQEGCSQGLPYVALC